MVKRTLGGLLWFVSMWCAYELAIYFAGGPRDPGPIIALGVAAFVVVDPLHVFWPAPLGRGHRAATLPSIAPIATD